MRRYTVKLIVLDILCLPDIIAHTIPVKRMPGDCHGQIIEDSLFVHPDLPDHDLLRRTAVYADRTLQVLCLHPFL